MKGYTLSLFVGTLFLAAAVVPAQAQVDVCMVGTFYTWDMVLDTSQDTYAGTVTAFTGGLAAGARGTNGRTIRHQTFTAINPNLADDPGCDDGAGLVDWFIYNGNITSGGPNYAISGTWYNSCGSEGTWSATITAGACPAPRQMENVPGSPGYAPPQVGEADAAVSLEGYAVSSSPNPFEAGATISYTIPEASDVRITVYDTLGRQVAVLVDAAREAGTHTVALDGTSLAAGTYVYRIEAGDYTEARQMVLAR